MMIVILDDTILQLETHEVIEIENIAPKGKEREWTYIIYTHNRRTGRTYIFYESTVEGQRDKIFGIIKADIVRQQNSRHIVLDMNQLIASGD